jgi:peptide/nickel transport system permease protein
VGAYLTRRLLLVVVTLYLVSTSLFFVVRFLPGDAIDAVLAGNASTYQGDREKLEKDLGLDKPLLVQYGTWMGNILRGDLGDSLFSRQPIREPVLTRGFISFVLGMFAMTIALAIGVPVGVASALKRNSFIDFSLRGFATLALAVPAFWLGLMMVVLPSKYFGWTPAGSFEPFADNPVAAVKSLLLPAVALGIPAGAVLMRYVRTEMLNVVSQDYVRTARAKGLRSWTVITRHSLRNTLIPVLSIIGIQVPALVGGSVVIERVFAIPGLGTYLLDSVQRRDYPTLQAVNLLVAAVVITSNLVVDMMYAVVDPRVRTA